MRVFAVIVLSKISILRSSKVFIATVALSGCISERFFPEVPYTTARSPPVAVVSISTELDDLPLPCLNYGSITFLELSGGITLATDVDLCFKMARVGGL